MILRYVYPILLRNKYADLEFAILWAEDEFFSYQNIDCTAQDCGYTMHIFASDDLTVSTLKEHEQIIMGEITYE